MSKRALILAAGVTATLLAGLSACGQKGPLYLPENAPQRTQPQAATPAPAASQPSSASPR